MKIVLRIFVLMTLGLISFSGCVAEKKEPSKVESSPSPFRTLNASQSETSDETRTVVCHNCTAQFKISNKIQKMSKSGHAVIDCPICHHNYLEKKE